MSSTCTNMFSPKPEWSVDQIPDLSGKVIIVTGGNTGIGKDTVKALLNNNAKVYIAGRNPPRVNEAIEDFKRETGKEALFLQVNLGDLNTIQHGFPWYSVLWSFWAPCPYLGDCRIYKLPSSSAPWPWIRG
ncbi:hypothetical protein BD309DRAFT_1073995 [Dichomitus squalens]|nr:hypothetical protein BD309DRAFT_1073995 [Dichomitus squalens]